MEAAPSPLANARPTKEKFCLRFLICAQPFFLLKGKQNFSLVFCSERAGGGCGLCFCSAAAEGGCGGNSAAPSLSTTGFCITFYPIMIGVSITYAQWLTLQNYR